MLARLVAAAPDDAHCRDRTAAALGRLGLPTGPDRVDLVLRTAASYLLAPGSGPERRALAARVGGRPGARGPASGSRCPSRRTRPTTAAVDPELETGELMVRRLVPRLPGPLRWSSCSAWCCGLQLVPRFCGRRPRRRRVVCSMVTEQVIVDGGSVGGATAVLAATAPAVLLAVGDVGDCRTGGDKGAATAALASHLGRADRAARGHRLPRRHARRTTTTASGPPGGRCATGSRR